MTDCFMGLNFLFAPINMVFTIFANMLNQIAILLVSEKSKLLHDIVLLRCLIIFRLTIKYDISYRKYIQKKP